ncbi:hypothetical protein [Chryseobacterium edaphi]|uniref:hypothetical protein n=1 Tax=Chryseobacterium edaphi TaxID=2976532 RepID=UPI0034A17394
MIAGFEDGSTNVHFSSADDVAKVVLEAATDHKKQLRYIAGPDAEQLTKKRQELGLEQHFEEVSELYSL